MSVIHKDRPGLPDIDIDTEGIRRVQVFNKVKEYFQSIGGDVIHVCSFTTEKTKGSIRTACRGLGIEDNVAAYLSSLIPNERGFDLSLDVCMNGDENHHPIAQFQTEMSKYKNLWEVASGIEGLITSLGVHPAGIVAVNDDFVKYNSVMQTSTGFLVSAYDLEDTEYMGGLKYDFLTVNALDKIRMTMNYLLMNNEIEWQGDLRSTYNKYLLPINLDISSEKMWEMAYTNKITDLFQFDTPVGLQAIQAIKPVNLAQLSIANTLMRLMKQEDATEMPADTYTRYKEDVELWYNELYYHNLDDKEIKTLEKYLLPLYGVGDSQEVVMMMTMDENIAGFNVTEANALRKAIAKKKKDILEKTQKMFYEKGIQLGTSQNMLDYVWHVQIGRQIGYSFSVLHTMGYSTIALQEMNLAYKYPIIYWNTACLSVNAGAINEEDFQPLIDRGIMKVSDEKDKRDQNKVQYGKVAAAVSRFKETSRIDLPDINHASFGFVPDANNNSIIFGMKGLSKIGDALIKDIIASKPYSNLVNFKEKVKISKDRVINLIKAGAFDNIETRTREEILKEFILSVSDQKKTLNLRNVQMLLKEDMIPQDEFAEGIRYFYFTKYIRQRDFKYDANSYALDEVAQDFYFEEGHDDMYLRSVMHGDVPMMIISKSKWDSIYKEKMLPIKQFIKDNLDELLTELNNRLFEREYEKYASGNKLSWELDSLGFYHSGHELEGIEEELPLTITSVKDLGEPKIVGYFPIKGKQVPELGLSHIVGTVLEKEKNKHLVYFSTPTGVINVKLYRNNFAKFDKKITYVDDNGKKVLYDDSWFKKGTKLLLTGIKRGDNFVLKSYKKTRLNPIIKLTRDEAGLIFTTDKPKLEDLVEDEY